MARVIVTGGEGFIGRPVVQALERRGYTVQTFDLPRHDVTDRDDVLRALEGASGVIHLAGMLGTHELFDAVPEAVRVNIGGTVNILDACQRHHVRYVGITMPQVFPSVYTATKVACQRLATAYYHTYGFPVAHVRAFNVFGPGQKVGAGHPQKLVPTASVALWRREPVTIWGDGEQTVDLVSTDDTARVLADALEVGNNVTIDAGTGVSFSVLSTVMMLGACVGRVPVLDFQPMRRGEVPTAITASGEGWEYLGGWRPTFRLDDLKATTDYYGALVGAVVPPERDLAYAC